MADGHLNKCKECAKKDVNARYYAKFDKIREYEKRRFQTKERKEKVSSYFKRYRAKYPEKVKARNMVANAVRDGKLIKKPCEVCGETTVQAHHEDYSKPLDVRWLCFKHHRYYGHNQTNAIKA